MKGRRENRKVREGVECLRIKPNNVCQVSVSECHGLEPLTYGVRVDRPGETDVGPNRKSEEKRRHTLLQEVSYPT